MLSCKLGTAHHVLLFQITLSIGFALYFHARLLVHLCNHFHWCNVFLCVKCELFQMYLFVIVVGMEIQFWLLLGISFFFLTNV